MIEFELISTPERFLALQPEWDALLARTASRRYSKSFTWARLGWLSTGAPRGRKLSILVMRQGGEAVLIWPMTVRRELGLWRTAGSLGAEFTEYAPVLVADGPDAAGHVQAAWRHLKAARVADVYALRHVQGESVVQAAMAGNSASRRTETIPSPLIRWDGVESWDAYWASRSKNTRQGFGRKMRRFEELGHVTFEVVEDPAEYAELVDWTLTHKLEWMARMGLDNDFMRTPEFRDFLLRIGMERTAQGRWITFVMKLDGRVIATKMGALDAQRYEGFIAVQDPAYQYLSAGTLILIKTLQWLLDRRLIYDFRIGTEPYKLDWATEDTQATTYQLASSAWGMGYLAVTRAIEQARIAKDRLRTMLPDDTRRRVKAWLKSPLTARRSPAAATAA